MRYLDTRVLQKLGLGSGQGARPRRYVWLVWMQPHFRPHAGRLGVRVNVRWPVYLLNGGS